MIKIVALLCRLADPTNCHEWTVSSSDFTEQLSMASCAVGVPGIVEWLEREHPGYRLSKWGCVIGSREKRPA